MLQEHYEAVMRRTLERSNRVDQRQKRWSWGGLSESDGRTGRGPFYAFKVQPVLFYSIWLLSFTCHGALKSQLGYNKSCSPLQSQMSKGSGSQCDHVSLQLRLFLCQQLMIMPDEMSWSVGDKFCLLTLSCCLVKVLSDWYWYTWYSLEDIFDDNYNNSALLAASWVSVKH